MAMNATTATSSDILVVDDIVKRFETADGSMTAVDHVSLKVLSLIHI